MSNRRHGLLGLFVLIPLSASADIQIGDLPDDTVWYFHADLETMRSGESRGLIYAWFEEEVAEDVREDVGNDITAAGARPQAELPTVPEVPADQPVMPDIRMADFTSPLTEELENLQSDIERARESIKKGLDFTF